MSPPDPRFAVGGPAHSVPPPGQVAFPSTLPSAVPPPGYPPSGAQPPGYPTSGALPPGYPTSGALPPGCTWHGPPLPGYAWQGPRPSGPMPPFAPYPGAPRGATRVQTALKVTGIVVGVTLAVVGLAAIGLVVLTFIAFAQSGSNK